MKNVIATFLRRMQAAWVSQPTAGSLAGTSVLLRVPIESVDWLRSWPAHAPALHHESERAPADQNDPKCAPAEKTKAEVYSPATYHLTNW